ncbi:MAG: hypothetical protein E6R04_00565 [Spirochaetes bacterium]|nr:MAG: hypothetical protein E6R04_00565 [Spirochaetota bacterium]
MSKNKEAVGNLGEEELNFMKHVRLTREDTRRDTNALFENVPQSRKRDQDLMNKLFVQAPGAQTMADNLLKMASASEQEFERFEKIKIAYNVHHFFESGAHLTEAQRRFPELLKVAGRSGSVARPAISLKKPTTAPTSGPSGDSNILSGASK